MMPDKNTLNQTDPPLPLPWYVHLLSGHALTGLLPWFLVARLFFYRGKNTQALLIFLVNLLIFAALALAALKMKIVWHTLLLLFHGVNILWSLGAWLFQRLYFGPAPKRYYISDWRTWLSRVITGGVLAAGLAILIAIFPIIGERLEMLYADDILDKQVILWDFFTYIPLLLPYGLLLGLWWAGQGRRFSAAHVITFLSGLIFFYITLGVTFQLFFFLVYKGQFTEAYGEWNLIPGGLTGYRHVLVLIDRYDYTALLVIPLLLGAVTRIRDFWKRSFAIIPVICILIIPLGFYSEELWGSVQGQIMYEMGSPDADIQDRAVDLAEMLQRRYPEHEGWTATAMRLARYHYNRGDFIAAKGIYAEIVERYGFNARWHREVAVARAAIDSVNFGEQNSGPAVNLPLVSFEPYLTPNWIALLQVIRYWQGEDIPESEILIELKLLSTDDEKLELSPMPGLAELDDAVSSLGYELTIMAVDKNSIQALLEEDIPVIIPIHHSFHLVYGIDESRSIIKTYNYNNISKRLMTGEKDEVREILSLQQEGKGESIKLLKRIADQAHTELPLSFFGSVLQKDSAPFMVVVYPDSAAKQFAAAVNRTPEAIKKDSNGYLAALISLAALDAADPRQCIEWAEISAGLIDDPLSLHIAYLAKLFWNTRDKLVPNKLGLDKQFSQLAQIDTYFNSDKTRNFLVKAEQQFKADLAADRLSLMVRRQLHDFFDPSDPDELQQLIQLARKDVIIDPANRKNWLYLAELYQWNDDVLGIVSALEGALDAGPWQDDLALRLAYKYVRIGDRKSAHRIMAMINPVAVKFNAHYFYCQASLANWEGDKNLALEYYAKAIDMRRYIPVYYLDYAELLLEQGRTNEAHNALKWAIRIDDRGKISGEAKKILQTILSETGSLPSMSQNH